MRRWCFNLLWLRSYQVCAAEGRLACGAAADGVDVRVRSGCNCNGCTKRHGVTWQSRVWKAFFPPPLCLFPGLIWESIAWAVQTSCLLWPPDQPSRPSMC